MAVITRVMDMPMKTEASLPLLRLMHLVSPSLPVGGFTYSQGIEWANESGWINTPSDLEGWLQDQLEHSLSVFDVPVLLRMHRAAQTADLLSMQRWCDELLAGRETAELRLEEQNRGRAFADLLIGLDLLIAADWHASLSRTQAAGFAYAAVQWRIDEADTALGYLWSWLENLVLAAIKIIPLGQTDGQRLLHRLTPVLPEMVELGMACGDQDIGASSPALAIASSLHETQYTRLFRS